MRAGPLMTLMGHGAARVFLWSACVSRPCYWTILVLLHLFIFFLRSVHCSNFKWMNEWLIETDITNESTFKRIVHSKKNNLLTFFCWKQNRYFEECGLTKQLVFPTVFSILWKSTVTIMFSKRKESTQVWNNLRVTKGRQHSYFWVNYPFTSLDIIRENQE